MAGISDIRHELCLALALWNGRDPILKERMFGLTGPQGNHGEDAKEYWWYLDGLPSHACCGGATTTRRRRFPTTCSSHHGRGLHDPELELLDTGAFDDDRYWSVDVTYAKASPTDDPDADRGREPRRRRGDARTCCRRCGSATRGPGTTAAARPRHRAATARTSRRPTTASPATGSQAAPGPDGAPLPRRCSATTRPTPLASTGPSRRPLPQGRDQRPRRLRRRRRSTRTVSAPRPRSGTG